MIECIDRGIMPQVDDADIPALLDFLSARGVSHERREVSPWRINQHQSIVPAKVKGIARHANAALWTKPPLVAHDYFVIDGNHRVAAAKVLHRPEISILRFSLDFDEALAQVRAFPKAYTLAAWGDKVRD